MSDPVLPMSADPARQTPETRARAVAALLAADLLRLLRAGGLHPLVPPEPVKTSRESTPNYLAVSPEKSVTVSAGYPAQRQRFQGFQRRQRMATEVAKELAALQRMGVAALRTKYAEVFGEATTSGNRIWLLRRIAWRVQANAEGDLSERARQWAAELARDADIRITAPKSVPCQPKADSPRTVSRELVTASDGRIPPPGSFITRQYQGAMVHVKVLADGFEYEGERYGSLSAVANAVTGSHCNGFLFFRLNKAGAA
jgi:hypothetical protein